MGETIVSPLSLLPSAGTWSLAEDDSLLLAMQELSLTLSTQTKQLLDKMDRLAISAASAQTRLQTTTNNFMLLSNIKFIEARVYEDSDLENKPEEIKTVQEETFNKDTSTTQALRHGFDVIQSAFEKIEINDSDSDSEVEDEKVISVLQPKNPYHVRSIPAVIGTQAWLDDDKIGLVEEELEEETDTSDSESEEEGAVPKKEESEYSDSDSEKTKQPKIHDIEQKAEESDTISDFSDDDELFKPKPIPVENKPKLTIDKIDSEVEQDLHEIDDKPDEVKSNTKSFASELSSKIGLGSTKIVQDTDHDQDTSDDENYTPPKPKKSVKLPPKKSVLFDSSDSDDDLFSPKPNASIPKIQTKVKPTESEKQAAIQSSKKLPPLPPPSHSKPSSDVKEDVISSSPIIPAASKNTDPDVESHSDDDFFSTISSKSTQKVSTEVNEGTKNKPTSAKSLFGDSSDDDDIFSDIKVTNKLKTDNTPSLEAAARKSLFDNSDGSDDLFADLIATKKAPEPLKTEAKIEKKEARKPFGGTPMFGGMSTSMLKDKSDKEDQPIQVDNSTKASIGEDKSTSDDDDIFTPKDKTKAPVPPKTEAVNEKVEVKKPFGGKPMFGMSTSMLTEKSDNDNQPIHVDPSIGASIGEGNPSSDEVDIFSPESKKVKPPSTPSAASKPKQEVEKGGNESSMLARKPFGGAPTFGGVLPIKGMLSTESTDDEDIFSPVLKNTSPPALPSAASKPINKSASEEEESQVKDHEGVNNETNIPNESKKPFEGVSHYDSFDPQNVEKSGHNTENTERKETLLKKESLLPIPFTSTNPKTTESKPINDEQEEMVPETVKPKKPVGGVSMFGGFNPAHLVKNIEQEVDIIDDKVKVSSDDTVDNKEPDQQSATLNTLTKSRPKMKGGRRPPTRAWRKNAVESSNAFSFDTLDGPSKDVLENNSSDRLGEKGPKAPIGGVSMLGGFNPLEMMKPNIIAGKKDLDLINTTKSEILSEDENKEATSVEVPAQIITKIPDLPPSSSMSQLEDKETFEPPPMTIVDEKQNKTNNLFGFDDSDSDDDMFSNIATTDKTSMKHDPIDNIFGDESDDDLFSSLTSKK